MLPPLFVHRDLRVLRFEFTFDRDPVFGTVITTWSDKDALIYDLRLCMSALQLFRNRNLFDVVEHTFQAVTVNGPREVWDNLELPVSLIPLFAGYLFLGTIMHQLGIIGQCAFIIDRRRQSFRRSD